MSPEQTPRPAQRPDLPPLFQAPNSDPTPPAAPDIQNQWDALADEELQAQWAAAATAEAQHGERAGRVADIVGELVTATQLQRANDYNTARVFDRRSVTSPDSPGKRVQTIKDRDDGGVDVSYKTVAEPPKPDETLLSQHTTVPLAKKIADRYIPSGDTPVEPPSAETLTASQRYEQQQIEERNRKQLLRQARSEWSEGVFSAGQGLGETAMYRTRLARYRAKQAIKKQYEAGEITAAEMHTLQGQAELQTRVVVPTRDVRRSRRRERAGAVLNAALDEQPSQKNDRARQLTEKMNDLHGVALLINDARDLRLELERETRRRSGEVNLDLSSLSELPVQYAVSPDAIRYASGVRPTENVSTPEPYKAKDIDSWEETLRWIKGEYRDDGHDEPLENLTLESLTSFLIARHGLIEKYAQANGLDSEYLSPQQLAKVQKEAYMEIRNLATTTFRQLVKGGIISTQFTEGEGFAVALTPDEINDHLEEYTTARDARQNRGRGRQAGGVPPTAVHGSNVAPQYAGHFEEQSLGLLYRKIGARITEKVEEKEQELGVSQLSQADKDEINVSARDEVLDEYGAHNNLPASVVAKFHAEMERIHQERMGRRRSGSR